MNSLIEYEYEYEKDSYYILLYFPWLWLLVR